MKPLKTKQFGIKNSILHIDGTGADVLNMKGGGSLNPPTHETVDNKMHYLYQEGKAVYKKAVLGMAEVSAEIVERNNLKPEDIAMVGSPPGKSQNYRFHCQAHGYWNGKSDVEYPQIW